MLTKLVNTLVATLGQNTANVALAIPLGISLANAEGEEALFPWKGRDATTNEAWTDSNACRRCARCRRQNTARIVHKNRKPTPKSHKIEHTRDLVFNRLERPVVDSNLDDDYDSEYEGSAGSRESADLRGRLDAWRAQPGQQPKNWPPVRATPKEERLTQMHAQIDRLLAEWSIPNPVWEVLSETQSPFLPSISATIPQKNFKMPRPCAMHFP